MITTGSDRRRALQDIEVKINDLQRRIKAAEEEQIRFIEGMLVFILGFGIGYFVMWGLWGIMQQIEAGSAIIEVP